MPLSQNHHPLGSASRPRVEPEVLSAIVARWLPDREQSASSRPNIPQVLEGGPPSGSWQEL